MLPLEQTPNEIISSQDSFEYHSLIKLTVARTFANTGGLPNNSVISSFKITFI